MILRSVSSCDHESPAPAKRHDLLVSDFDNTLSFNDSASALSHLLGIEGFEDKVSETCWALDDSGQAARPSGFDDRGQRFARVQQRRATQTAARRRHSERPHRQQRFGQSAAEGAAAVRAERESAIVPFLPL